MVYNETQCAFPREQEKQRLSTRVNYVFFLRTSLVVEPSRFPIDAGKRVRTGNKYEPKRDRGISSTEMHEVNTCVSQLRTPSPILTTLLSKPSAIDRTKSRASKATMASQGASDRPVPETGPSKPMFHAATTETNASAEEDRNICTR